MKIRNFKGRYCAIQTDEYNRINPKMGRVTKFMKGADANVPAANVEYISNGKNIIIILPVNTLYPVELNNNEA